MDVTPKGRDEAETPGMGWLRHHDRYDATNSSTLGRKSPASPVLCPPSAISPPSKGTRMRNECCCHDRASGRAPEPLGHARLAAIADRAQRTTRHDAEVPGVRGRLCHTADRLRDVSGSGKFAPLVGDFGLVLSLLFVATKRFARSMGVIITPWGVRIYLRETAENSRFFVHAAQKSANSFTSFPYPATTIRR